MSLFHQLKFVVSTSLQTNSVYLQYFKLNSGRSNNQVAKVKGLKNWVPLPVEKKLEFHACLLCCKSNTIKNIILYKFALSYYVKYYSLQVCFMILCKNYSLQVFFILLCKILFFTSLLYLIRSNIILYKFALSYYVKYYFLQVSFILLGKILFSTSLLYHIMKILISYNYNYVLV